MPVSPRDKITQFEIRVKNPQDSQPAHDSLIGCVRHQAETHYDRPIESLILFGAVKRSDLTLIKLFRPEEVTLQNLFMMMNHAKCMIILYELAEIPDSYVVQLKQQYVDPATGNEIDLIPRL